MQMAAAWYGTGIGSGGGGGDTTTTAQKAMAAAAVAATVTVTIPKGGSAGYLLRQMRLMTRVVGEAASQLAVGG